MGAEFSHIGPIISYKTRPQPELDPASALTAIRLAWSAGRLQITPHFHKRAGERAFDVMDAENVVRDCSIAGRATFCPNFENWKYKLVGPLDDSKSRPRRLALVVALDPTNDYSRSPLAILVTAYWIGQ